MAYLAGKIAIVSGASSGLGRAAALLFASQGAGVVVGARRPAELAAVVDEIRAAGGRAEAVVGDATHEDTSEAMVAKALSSFGRLDVGFNNAGAFLGAGPTPQLSVETWREALDVNLTSAFLGAKHQIPAIAAAGGGSVFFSGGYLGTAFALPMTAAYATGKAALVGLARSLAVEFGPAKVRVNVLVPGSIDSEAFRAVNDTPEKVASFAAMNALGRVASPEEIARTALYLASDASSFTTGSVLYADGGISIARAHG